MIIRPGTIDDCRDINEIYNWYIKNTTITFDVESWDLSKRQAWLEQFLDEHSCYFLNVAEQDSITLGFAFNSHFRPKAAYDTSTEVTIYTNPTLSEESRPAGLGTLLYSALFENINQTSLHRAYAAIGLPNDVSIALHQKFGFNHVGTLTEVGTKFGDRVDVAWYEKALTR